MPDIEVIVIPNDIKAYIHCRRCIEERRRRKAHVLPPRDYARLSVGWTPKGLQIWCVRHDLNVAHIDFEGQQHPAR